MVFALEVANWQEEGCVGLCVLPKMGVRASFGKWVLGFYCKWQRLGQELVGDWQASRRGEATRMAGGGVGMPKDGDGAAGGRETSGRWQREEERAGNGLGKKGWLVSRVTRPWKVVDGLECKRGRVVSVEGQWSGREVSRRRRISLV